MFVLVSRAEGERGLTKATKARLKEELTPDEILVPEGSFGAKFKSSVPARFTHISHLSFLTSHGGFSPRVKATEEGERERE